MHVRTATPEDAEALPELHSAAVRGVDPGAYDRRQLAAWDHDRDPGDYPVEDPDQTLVVARRDGDLAGFGWADLTSGEVTAVYVHPDHAGRGVGSALLAHLEGRLAAWGHDEVGLLASKNAVGFYRGAGYRQCDEEEVEQPGGVSMTCVWLSKPLDPSADPPAPNWGRLPA